MSHSGDLFALGDGVATEPSFEVALRGYDKKQVDRYVAQVESEVATLAAEREQAFHQVQALAGQVRQLQAALAEARQRTGSVGRPSFRHLGHRVEQILALAEDQAEAIRAGAVKEIEDRRAAADKALAEANRKAERLVAEANQRADRLVAQAREQAATASRDFEVALAARRDEQERAEAAQEAAQAELAAIREQVAAAQAELAAVREQVADARAEEQAPAGTPSN